MTEAQHTAVRRSVGNAFTTNSLLDYESYIDVSSTDLLEALREHPKADLTAWLQLFTMDVLMRIAFNESLGFLQREGDVEGILAAVIARFDHWGSWAAMPTLDYLIDKNAWTRKLKKSGDSPLARVALAKMRSRSTSLIEQPEEQKKDLMAKFLQGQAKHPNLISDDEILGIIMSTIGAGADTTGGTLTYTFFLLCKHPQAMARLRRELDEAVAEGALSNPPRYNDVHRLPYLEAVLKESMRFFPIAAWGLDRVVPPTGTTIAGQPIPGGTVVGCQIDAVQRDRDVYGEDATRFRPERWLEASDEQKRRMDRGFIAFSAGKRICMGLHIAWLELKKVVPLILMNFEVSSIFRHDTTLPACVFLY